MSIRLVTLSVVMLFLAACGGSSGGGDDGGNAQRPVAIATVDVEQVNAGEQSVALDGSESHSPNGSITGWEWRFISQPAGSEADIADIEGADQGQAMFTPDLPGEYVVLLTVSDAEGRSEDTQEARATVLAVNPNPLAVVSDEINWILGTVQLDGSRSQAPDGGDRERLIYEWTLTEKPDGSEAELDQGSLIYPRFTADVVGTYRAELIVHYDDRVSRPATTTINIVEANSPPMPAIAELSGTIVRGQTVTLDGSGSQDANGDPLQYRWRFLNRPDGSQAQLSGATTDTASYVVDVKALQAVELCVYDGIARRCTNIIIRPTDIELPDGAANTPPVAVISPDDFNQATFEAELGAFARLGSDSYDIDDDAVSEQWSFVSYPDGFDPDASANLDAGWSSGFTPTVEGEYVVRLTASDGQANHSVTQTYTARLGANRAPLALAATATGNPTVMAGESITFDGEGSSDPDDNRLTYEWWLVDRPDNSEAELQQANTAFPTLTTDAPGPYIVALQVTDEHGWLSEYEPGFRDHEVLVMAKGFNNPPFSRLDASVPAQRLQSMALDSEQPFAIKRDYVTETNERYGRTVTFRQDSFVLMAESQDPDGDVLSHLWTLVSEPADNRMEIITLGGGLCDNGQPRYEASEEPWEDYRERITSYREWTCENVDIAPTEAGLYVFEYQVYDGSEFAGPYSKTVHAVERDDYPSLLLEIQHHHRDSWRQSAFPWDISRGFSLRRVSESPVSLEESRIRLSAIGGDYTLINVDTPSDDARYPTRFWDLTHNQPVTEGYSIPQGESIEIVFQVEIPADELPNGDRALASELAERMNAANITGGRFDVAEKPGWSVEITTVFSSR
ncbi:PKD domain-containing protein [Marinimicrobium sp. ARAG 43.8]|uniref:PKD domain-containing protein n=1 Tax=Marinimicrobium sp. ARAG 43.8 TaxID=3418719 RepID=UPI003CF8D6BF